jgi:hypothetical protein
MDEQKRRRVEWVDVGERGWPMTRTTSRPHRPLIVRLASILYLPPGSLVSFHHSSVNGALSIDSVCYRAIMSHFKEKIHDLEEHMKG